MIYKTASETYIKDNISMDMLDLLLIPAFNLSAVLSDIKGKISDHAALQINQRLNVSPPGILVLGKSVTEALRPRAASVIPHDDFIPEMSYFAFEKMTLLKNNDASIRSSIVQVSEFLSFDKYMVSNTYHQIASCCIYMDVFALYHGILGITPEEGLARITQRDIIRIMNNIQCLSGSLESLGRPPFEYISILRDLYRTISYIKSLKSLFNESYLSKVEDFIQATGEVRE